MWIWRLAWGAREAQGGPTRFFSPLSCLTVAGVCCRLQLGAAGIKPEDLNFKSVTMDSGKFVCIRETAAQTIAIIDTANPTNVQRMPAPVELACVHPDGQKLVLCAAAQVQIYNVTSKEKIQACALPEPAVFVRWMDENTLGIVTGTAVFHWGMGDSEPTKKFDRHPTLAQSQIISYKASPDGMWLLLNGIAGGAEGITGQLQLFSVERNVSQPVPAHSGKASFILPRYGATLCGPPPNAPPFPPVRLP